METGRLGYLALWRNFPGTVALYGALLVHMVLALRTLYRRRTLRMPAWEALQLLLGLLIPPLLASHVIGTRVASHWYGTIDSYGRVVSVLGILRPELGLRQVLVVVLAWSHGCLGLHFWLRLRPAYARHFALVIAGYVLLPVLALLGFLGAVREIWTKTVADPEWITRTVRATDPSAPDTAAALSRLLTIVLAAYGGALAAVLIGRLARALAARRHRIRIAYPGGREVTVPRGFTVLEASRAARIPHASVCGGRGRCSTCRVRVVKGHEGAPPPGPDELRVLRRVDAAPTVRLACQLRPTGDVVVEPLLPPGARVGDGATPGPATGREREVAVVFADLRSFTAIAERRLPYDVVFLLNRYFEAMAVAVHRAGGIVNQFTGDGVMALFGVETEIDEGCRQALDAAVGMVDAIAQMSRELAEELDAPLRIGVGIHAGPAVVGRMGYGDTVYLTAVGDTVHVASRLQDLTKLYTCPLVISEHVADRAGLDATGFPRHELAVRNRTEPLAIRVIDDVHRLRATTR
jgi:adenylate cyclase